MLAPTPPMGWNSWNTFGGDISEEVVRQTADAFLDTGLKDAGYRYVVIDDCWSLRERGPDGRIVADPGKFPSGMKALADYVHAKGLRFGMYSCVGTQTCAGYPGSFANEELDARTFAEWGVDFLKYDYCYKPAGADGKMLYRRMGQALRQTGRPILYSMCNWGRDEPWKWAASCGAHMWRTTGDIVDSWKSIVDIGFSQDGLEAYAGPNRWNDPDMLVVGLYGKGNVGFAGGCTDAEYRTHFGLWCLLASPLMIGCDVRSMTPFVRGLLTTKGAIAVNQDPLGVQARRIGEPWLHGEVWAKPLHDGSVAAGLFNRTDNEERLVPLAWESAGLHDRREAVVSDLWTDEEIGAFRGSYVASVGPHDCALVKVTPVT